MKQTALHGWGTRQMSGSMHFDLKAFTAFNQAPIGHGI